MTRIQGIVAVAAVLYVGGVGIVSASGTGHAREQLRGKLSPRVFALPVSLPTALPTPMPTPGPGDSL